MSSPHERAPALAAEALSNPRVGGQNHSSGQVDTCSFCDRPAVWTNPANGFKACKSCREETIPPVLGSDVIDSVVGFLDRFVAYPSEHARVAHALWILHTHLMDVWESTPRLAFLSPEPASGKTRALEVTELLVPNPVIAVNMSSAYIFRKVGADDQRPTILYDEIDTIFGPKAKEHEETRGLLNAGHRRGAVAGRCVVRGKTVTTEELPAYAAVALAGLGDLPDTIFSRSVIVRMRRRAPGETVEPFRRRLHAPQAEQLRVKIEVWASNVRPQVEGVWPEMPEGIEDRDADVWEPLLAIADAVGGDWPTIARVSAVSLVSLLRESNTVSLGIRLLTDLRAVFDDNEVMFSEDIISGLTELEEAPWGDLKGKAINFRGLSRRLHTYGVSSKQVRVGDKTAKGYTREDLWDVWQRYLPPVSPLSSTTTEVDVNVKQQQLTPVEEVSLVSHESETSETSDSGSPLLGVYAGDYCRCGSDVEHYTKAGFPYCDTCGPPDNPLGKDVRVGNGDASKFETRQ